MSTGPGRGVLANPFFVVLMIVSTAFMVTVMLLFVDTLRQQPDVSAARAAVASPLSTWLESHGMTALLVQFGLMFVSGVLAMALDHKFSPASARKDSGR